MEEFQPIAIQFSDLADCTEYFYNELGKLDSVAMTKREYKKLHKLIMRNFFASLAILKQRQSLQTEVDKFTISNYKEELKNAQKAIHPKNTLKNVDESKKIELSKPEEVIPWTPQADDDTQTE